jgi:hypothetical protein
VNLLYCIVVSGFISTSLIFTSMVRSDLVAINSIEKELHQLLIKKPIHWQEHARSRIGQLRTVYVPKGYDLQKVEQFAAQVSPVVIPVIEPAQVNEQSIEPIVLGKADMPVSSREEERVEGVKPLPEVSEKGKESIVHELDDLITTPEENRTDDWSAQVNRHVFALAVIDSDLAKKYFKKIHIKKESEKLAVPEEPVVVFEEPVILQEKSESPGEVLSVVHSVPEKTDSMIIEELEKLIAVPSDQKNESWERKINALLFDLAFYDKEKAAEYLKKIYKQPVLAEALPKVSGGPTPPPMPGMPPLVKAGGPPPPPPMPGMPPMIKAGGPPPPPPMPGLPKPGGPPAPPLPGGVKPGAPLPTVVKKPVLTPSVLRKMDGPEVLKLFNEHLDALKSSWNILAEERVEVRTKYGSRVEIIRGAPDLGWKNIVNTLKKSLIEKKVMTVDECDQKINERIDQVRAEKKTAKADITSVVEKASEEPTQVDIERQLKALLSNPQTAEISWLVGIKGGIKNLDKLNHDAALKYQEDFIQIMPKEKRFIKP